MSPFEIALIIIGIACIIASCFLVEHKQEETVETELGSVTEQMLYAQLSNTNDKIAAHLDELKESVFEKTEDEMDRISNQKIMAVHEYSNQVMGDIKKSHDEVMFLYQMLTDKEAELKNSFEEIKKTKLELERICDKIEHRVARNEFVDMESLDFNEREPFQPSNQNRTKGTQSSKEIHEKNKINPKTSSMTPKSKEKAFTKGKNLLEVTQLDENNHYTKTLQEIEKEEFSSHIEEIIHMSNQGYSVIEISKKLGLGQGEVKLVLDYNKK